MNEKIMSGIRSVLVFLGGLAVAYGYTDEGTVTEITGGIAAAIGFLWSQFARTEKAIVASAAAIVPVSPSSQKSVGIDETITPSA